MAKYGSSGEIWFFTNKDSSSNLKVQLTKVAVQTFKGSRKCKMSYNESNGPLTQHGLFTTISHDIGTLIQNVVKCVPCCGHHHPHKFMYKILTATLLIRPLALCKPNIVVAFRGMHVLPTKHSYT